MNKKKRRMTFGQRIAYLFRHYTVQLLLALACGVLAVLLISYCAPIA